MISGIIESISRALFDEFNCEVFAEKIHQKLTVPCFHIGITAPRFDLFLKKRYFWTIPFVIRYFPENEDNQAECINTAERLWACLEYLIPIGEDRPILGTNMHYEILDNVLHFFINYDLFIRVLDYPELMQELTQYIEVN